MNTDNQFLGALLDNRPQHEQDKDPKFEEIVGEAAPVNWVEKPESSWRKFPDFDQKQSSMCGAFSMAKLMGVYYWLKYGVFIEFSPEDIYQRRANRYSGGMYIEDLYKIIGEGVTLKQLTNAKITNDTDADNCVIEPFKRDVGSVFAMGSKVVLPNDIETIASTIQKTGKAVHFLTYFTSDEWSKLIPMIADKNMRSSDPKALRHYVTGVDYVLKDGKKYIVIEDSAPFGGLHRRLLSAEWIALRSIVVTYPMKFKFESGPAYPVVDSFQFTRTMKFSPVFYVDADVRRLQDILKILGCMPANIESSGWYGGITCRAVMAFQRKYNVASETEIQSLGGEVFGPKSLAVINQLIK